MIHRVLVLTVICVGMAAGSAAMGQAYPAKPIRIVTEFIAGAGQIRAQIDLVGRIVKSAGIQPSD